MNTFFKIMLISLFAINVNAQKTFKDSVILHTWKVDKSKSLQEQTSFEFNDKESSQNYHLKTNKKETQLIHTKSKRIVERYKLPNLPPYNFSCEEQESRQWEYFRRVEYPRLVAIANRNCNSFKWCIPIYCNREIRMYVMMLIQPTVLCPQLQRYDVIKNQYKFKN